MCCIYKPVKASNWTMWLQQLVNTCQGITWQIGKKDIYKNRHQITTNRRKARTYFVSSETQEHWINILILVSRIGFNLILQLLLANLYFVLSDSHAIREEYKSTTFGVAKTPESWENGIRLYIYMYVYVYIYIFYILIP